MTDTLSSASPSVVRLTRYTATEQSEILGDGADPFGVADAGLSWLPKDEHDGAAWPAGPVRLLSLPM
ncbi:hypothetical protein [Streptomyces lydicus]|uniref:hypothetical protein n=1 Tax=Streptomyces lydicus TaxID=47763 RepID=UPI0037A29B9F